ncbi:hypothetical protein C8J57DRAFT_1241864 [Mycena rebaudengoi]|nr:hypothetical protein C8J57DRAFT_1241864 [Mycena rebaudengoi]
MSTSHISAAGITAKLMGDLDVRPAPAKDTLKRSHSFGVALHASTVDCPALMEAIQFTMSIEQKAKLAYISWIASGTNLGLNDWVCEQKAMAIKLEPVDAQMPLNGPIFIDLTEDDDD